MKRAREQPGAGSFDGETTPLARAAVSDLPVLAGSAGRVPRHGSSPLRRLEPFAMRAFAYGRAHQLELVATFAAFALGVVAPQLLLRVGFAAPIASSLRTMDLDEERIALVSQAIATLGGAFLGAALTRRRLAALLGACAYIFFWYILPFMAHAQHPPADLGGLVLVLRSGALEQVTLTLAAFGVVAAGAGAALGGTFGALAVVPIVTLVTYAWRWARHTGAAGRDAVARASLSLALAAVFVAALAIVGGNAGNLLMYGLTSNIYRLAGTTSHQEQPLNGTVSAVKFLSPALGMERTFYIYLPPSYAVAAARRYPTLYILHGSPGGPADWVQGGKAGEIEDALVAAGKMRETILVCPDGNGPKVRVSEWANTYDRRQRMEDAITGDLVKYVDQHYRTLADAADRAIAGNSEGGYGAANLALHHSDVFSESASFGGYFEAPPNETGVFGGASSPARAYNSPSIFISTASGNRAAHQIVFYVCVGRYDRVNLYSSGVNFAAKLKKLGVKSELITSPGAHSWSVWIDQLTATLEQMEPPAIG